MAEPFYKAPQHVGAWAQPGGPNTTMYYLGCVGLDDITEGGGDINTLFRCYDASGKWTTRGATRTLPEPITTTVTELLPKTASWLETIKQGADCPFPFYLNIKSCPPNDVFAGADRWWTLEKAYVGAATLSDMLSMDDEVAPKVAFGLSAEPPMIWGHAVGSDRITFTGTEGLNDIASCTTPQCGGDCGDMMTACHTLVAVADATGASADVWFSFDYGATWVAGATDPYSGTTSDLNSVVCFAVDSDTTRVLVAREPFLGTTPKVYYSDDWGANWTEVVVDTTVTNYGAFFGGALFSLDYSHVWLVMTDTSGSAIYFSDDGGASWTRQYSNPAAVLYGIWFADADDGMCVGSTDDVYTTTDGGATWGAATATGGGDTNYYCTENGDGIWWIGTDAGEIWYSADHGVTWAQRAFPGSGAGSVYTIDFATPTVGFMAHNPTNATSKIYRTRDGGFTWELESGTIPGELYSIHACTPNLAYAVGEIDTTALVYKVHD